MIIVSFNDQISGNLHSVCCDITSYLALCNILENAKIEFSTANSAGPFSQKMAGAGGFKYWKTPSETPTQV